MNFFVVKENINDLPKENRNVLPIDCLSSVLFSSVISL